jgi:hypothetical protein
MCYELVGQDPELFKLKLHLYSDFLFPESQSSEWMQAQEHVDPMVVWEQKHRTCFVTAFDARLNLLKPSGNFTYRF